MIGVERLQETADGLLLGPTPSERWKNFALMAGLALIPAAIALGSAWRRPQDNSGLFWGSLLTLLMLAWGLVFALRWAELRVDKTRKHLYHRIHHWGNYWISQKHIPFSAVTAVQVKKKERLGYSTPEPYGRLQILDQNGDPWASLDFETLYLAQQAHKRILEYLKETRAGAMPHQ